MNDTTPGTVEAQVSLVEGATDRFVSTVERLPAEDLREPSLLPGWTRGHVVAHVARNAYALVNLLRTAAGGPPTPMYPSVEARNEAIEEGSTRGRDVLLAELADSGRAWAQAALAVPADRWDAEVEWIGGRLRPARAVLSARLREVEFHHVDLDAGYSPAHWDPAFVARELGEAAAALSAAQGGPEVLLLATDADVPPAASPTVAAPRPGGAFDTLTPPPVQPSWRVAGDGEELTVSGPAAALLAWVCGRSSGDGLLATSGVLPQLPAWP